MKKTDEISVRVDNAERADAVYSHQFFASVKAVPVSTKKSGVTGRITD